jgi:hypothetical protein
VIDPREISRRVRGALRDARAYLAGFGTSGSLLAGAALMFIVASALVSFRGWPHVAAQPSPGEVVVSPRPASSAASPVGRRLVLISASPTAAVVAPAAAGARTPVAAGARRAASASPGHSLGSPVHVSRPGGPPAPGAPAGPSPIASGAPTAGCSHGCGPTSSGNPSPGPVPPPQQVVGQLGGTLGNVVSSAGKTAGSAVQQTTNTAGGAVQQVSPPAATTVQNAGSGAANTITQTTNTVAGTLGGIGQH